MIKEIQRKILSYKLQEPYWIVAFYDNENVIVYNWVESRRELFHKHFNFTSFSHTFIRKTIDLITVRRSIVLNRVQRSIDLITVRRSNLPLFFQDKILKYNVKDDNALEIKEIGKWYKYL